MPNGNEHEQQIETVLRLLKGKRLSKDSPALPKALEWVSYLRGVDQDKARELISAIVKAFDIAESEVFRRLEGEEVVEVTQAPKNESWDEEKRLENMIKESQWLTTYARYTSQTESPLSFHVFCSLGVLGAAVGRRVKKPMGFFDIYLNQCSVLIGPTGRVKKTAAVDIAKEIIHDAVLCPIMADKVTPESLQSALVQSGHQFIYAPEFSVFFGRQKYNEGLTTLIIRLLDCPPSFRIKTITRGEEEVTGLALTILGGSTLSLLSSSTPEEVTSSGFLNRFMLINEADTHRNFPEPARGSDEDKRYIMAIVKRLQAIEGDMFFDEKAKQTYSLWYGKRKEVLRQVPDDITAEVLERGASHIIRIASLIHLADCDTFCLCNKCFITAMHILDYVESHLPSMLNALKRTGTSQDTDYVVQALTRLGGAADHSTLLRRVASRMTSMQFRQHIKTLEEQLRIKVSQRGAASYYILRKEEE